MLITLYATIGCLIGWAARHSARVFAARYLARGDTQFPTENSEAGNVPGGSCPDLASVGVTVAVLAGLSLIGAYAGWREPSVGHALVTLILCGVLVTISLVDWAVHRIPNVLCLVLLGCAVAQATWTGRPSASAMALGLAVGGGLFLLVAVVSRGAMGAGDVKLAAVLGVLLGFPSILQALLLAIVAAGSVAFVLLLARRVGRKGYIAYGPYLALGALVVLIRLLGT